MVLIENKDSSYKKYINGINLPILSEVIGGFASADSLTFSLHFSSVKVLFFYFYILYVQYIRIKKKGTS